MVDQAAILTVFRSGGDYEWSHVLRLRRMTRAHAAAAPFYCLTDCWADPAISGSAADHAIGLVPLVHGWPGWWSKLELFRVRGPALYIDLDTTIADDLSPLLEVAERERFTGLRDFNPHQRELGSGLMAWSGDLSPIYTEFRADPERHMRAHRAGRAFGDQGFIEPRTAGRSYWQDLLPGLVVSYKKHCLQGVPEGARVICYHGQPRPWHVEAA